MAELCCWIVDPDDGARALLGRDLRHRYGDRHRILAAASADEALQTLAQLSADKEPVALLVVAQPPGIEFLRQARQRVSGVKRVLVTS